MNRIKAVIWDWNGTLFDDVEISLQTVNKMLSSRGMTPINMEQYYSYIDTPIIKFYEHIFDLNVVSPEVIRTEYYTWYGEYAEELDIPPELHSIVEELSEKGVKQLIVSGYEKQSLEKLMKKYDIGQYMTHISGAENRKAESKLERVKNAISLVGLAPEECVMIGDTLQEYEISRVIGTKCIMVGWGHHDPKMLSKLDCSFASKYIDLHEILIKNLIK